MTGRPAPFQPHPDGRRRCVEYTPRLDAQELAWAGILEHGMDGDLWPFEELTEHCEHLARLGHDTEVMELESISILASTGTTRRLGLSLKAGRFGLSPDHAHTTWKDLHLKAKPAPFGGHRWWFVCCRVPRRHLGSPTLVQKKLTASRSAAGADPRYAIEEFDAQPSVEAVRERPILP